MNRREFLRGLGGVGLAALVGGSQIAPRATHAINISMMPHVRLIAKIHQQTGYSVSNLMKLNFRELQILDAITKSVK